MTVGVYALVAAIVKLDDAGLTHIQQRSEDIWACLKRTIAMFMVGAGILVHGFPNAHELLHHLAEWLQIIPMIGSFLSYISGPLVNTTFGLIMGGIVLLCVNVVIKVSSSSSKLR